jgi:hypothetical protein
MRRYRYPMINEFWRVARVAGRALAVLLGVILAAELLRVWVLLHRITPWMGFAYLIGLAAGGAWLTLRLLAVRDQCRTLRPPHLPPPEHARHDDLKRYVQYLVLVLKRLSDHPALPGDQRKHIRQRAYDLEGLLGSHPLNEDLVRAISRAGTEMIQPALEVLDREALEQARYKMQAVVEDVIEPPFPVINPAVVFYHQITLISTILDTYRSRASLCEYWMVIRDVWEVMMGGDFFRIGQRLFEGVYANSPPMGRATDDLGQAISTIWLTWSVSQAAMHRCRTLQAWTPELAIEHLDARTLDSLLITRDTLIRDVLPVLKLRIRHSVGPGAADAAGFSEQVVQGIAKSVDTIVQAIRAQPPEKAAQTSRRTQPGLSRPEELGEASPSGGEGRTPSDWRRRGMFRVFRTFRDRVHYSKQSRHLHD